MSFPCVLGMNEVGWEDGAYQNNGMTPKLGGRTNNGGSKASNQGFEIVGGKSNGEVASYLFQRQGVATSFSKTVAENDKGNFSGQRWSSVGEGMSEQVRVRILKATLVIITNASWCVCVVNCLQRWTEPRDIYELKMSTFATRNCLFYC